MSVKIEKTERIGIINLNNVRTNSFNLEFLIEIKKSISILDNDDDIAVIIIKSALPFGFSSGLDLGNFYDKSEKKTAQNILKATSLVYEINMKILKSKKIYIAEISGPVIGSALSIIFSCDLRIACDNTWFWSPDPQYGGLLADGGIEIMKELSGVSSAFIMHITNDRINIKDAFNWGLIYKISTKEDLDKITISTAQKLIKLSPQSLLLTKKIINKNINIVHPKKYLTKFFNEKGSFDFLKLFLSKK